MLRRSKAAYLLGAERGVIRTAKSCILAVLAQEDLVGLRIISGVPATIFQEAGLSAFEAFNLALCRTTWIWLLECHP